MGVSPVRKMGVSRRRNTTRPRPNPREVPCPLDLAANSLTAGSAGQARRAALPPASHLLANLYLFFSGRLLAELFKEAADTGEAPG
jgi:hypothetical protein